MGRTGIILEQRATWGNWGPAQWIQCVGFEDETCDRLITVHLNGQRTRCTARQLNSLAARRRQSWSVKHPNQDPCVDCGKSKGKTWSYTRKVLSKTRSPRCPKCRRKNLREVKNRSRREREAWAREEL